MSFDFGGGSAEQHQLQRSCIVDVGREIEQVFACPPQTHRCAERIVLLKQECPGAYERHDQLEQAAAERHHEAAERRKYDVAGFVKYEIDEVEE